MKAFTTYECEICGEQFVSMKKVEACEAQGVDDAIVKVGDIVFMRASYGWFDGDPAWVSNPDVRPNGGGPTAKPRCPQGDTNCLDECCCFKFYYVVTAVDAEGHRRRYHVETLAMTGAQGHRGPGFTFGEHHVRPKLVDAPPTKVVKSSKALLGHKAKYLF